MDDKQKVLVVDDEPRNLRIIQLSLQDQWTIELVDNGKKALEVAESFKPDVILLDIMMPDIDGYEVCRRLRANTSMLLTKIILVSGKAMLEERLKGYEVGADDYVTKPFVPEELAAKVNVFMRLNKAENSLKDLNANLEQQVKDRTEKLIAAEALLVSSAKMSVLGEMAGGIAHEINTPLAAIGLRASQITEVIDENGGEPKVIRDMAVQIESTVERIAKIVYGLLAFSRQGKNAVAAPYPVDKIVQSTLDLCGERFRQMGIDLSVKLNCTNAVYCHHTQASQVLMNLLNNALDAVSAIKSEKLWISIEVNEFPEMVDISVTDCGPGIDKSVCDRMFQPFFTTKEVGKGTGLGLSVSKGLMESQGGTLFYDETAKNTRFVMRLSKKGGSVK